MAGLFTLLFCLGFTGEFCQYQTDYCADSPCKNGGVCKSTSVGYQCSCSLEFYGSDCQLRSASVCAEKPCPLGECIETGSSYTCDCSEEPGIDDDTCEDIDECELYPDICENGGICSNLFGDYNCTCSEGFTGKNCTDVDCSTVDCNHGSCVENFDKWYCDCNDFYHGLKCDIPSACASNPCFNGTCIEDRDPAKYLTSYTCDCNSGWLNDNCSIYNCTLQPNYCMNGGQCRMIYDNETQWIPQCECPSGWSSASLCAEAIIQELPPEWIWAPIVAVVAAILLVVAVVLFFRIKQKRATGGNYSPSRQEAIGTRVELEDIIKPPPEERLI